MEDKIDNIWFEVRIRNKTLEEYFAKFLVMTKTKSFFCRLRFWSCSIKSNMIQYALKLMHSEKKLILLFKGKDKV
jgi:hypothetical protein